MGLPLGRRITYTVPNTHEHRMLPKDSLRKSPVESKLVGTAGEGRLICSTGNAKDSHQLRQDTAIKKKGVSNRKDTADIHELTLTHPSVGKFYCLNPCTAPSALHMLKQGEQDPKRTFLRQVTPGGIPHCPAGDSKNSLKLPNCWDLSSEQLSYTRTGDKHPPSSMSWT